MLAKLSYSVKKTFFYEALTCIRTLGIMNPIYFEKKSICMIFGCGDFVFYQPNLEISSLTKRNNHLNRKKYLQETVPWYLLHFFETSMPKIHSLLKN